MSINQQEFVDRLVASGVSHPKAIIGCSENEVRLVEESAGLHLPSAYKHFLLVMGRRAGLLLRDVYMFYDDMIGLNQLAIRKLELCESGNLQLPENAFVFALRGGEQFTFFIADGSAPDPAVYSYFENDGHFKKLSDSFWGFLEIERQGIENLLSERAHNEE